MAIDTNGSYSTPQIEITSFPIIRLLFQDNITNYSNVRYFWKACTIWSLIFEDYLCFRLFFRFILVKVMQGANRNIFQTLEWNTKVKVFEHFPSYTFALEFK